MASIGSETVTVIRKPRRDRLDDSPGPAASEHDLEGCAVVPRASNEEGKGWVNTEGFMVAAPFGSDITEDDQVRVRGKVYDVDGVPGQFVNKRGKGKAVIVNLKRLGS